MFIFLLVIGSILTIFSLPIFISTNKLAKDEAEFENFIKHAEDINHPLASYPADFIYGHICKINNVVSKILIFGLLLLSASVVLLALGYK